MIRTLHSFLVIAAILLGGCTLIPPYTRPEAPVPAEWPESAAYRQPPSPSGAPIAADLEWQHFFTDKRLQAVIEMALDHNRDLRIAALTVEKARALYRIQHAELLPAVEATGKGMKQRLAADVSGTGHSMSVEQYEVNLGISSWEMDFFGRIRSLEQRALAEYAATEQARIAAQILLISEVANAYLTLAADRENLQLARSTLEAQQAAHRLILRRYEIGLVSELDSRQAQTRVETARLDVARYAQLTALDENALNLLAGTLVPAEFLPGTLGAIDPLPDVSSATPSEVLLRRPDILQAESLLKAANANIGAARAALFPRISLTSDIGTASDDLSGLFTSGSLAWNFSPKIVMPVFDARAWSALSATQVDTKIILTQYEKAIQGAFREVADTLAKRGTLADQMVAQQSLVEATSETYRISTARYTRGIDIYLNVLDSQRALYAAQQGLTTIRLAQLSNQVRLYAVLGGGGNTIPVAP
jgi:outer membrane protein, multidrug efflux system